MSCTSREPQAALPVRPRVARAVASGLLLSAAPRLSAAAVR